MSTGNIIDLLQEPGPRCMEDLEFSAEDISESIKTIKYHASAGPDGISSLLLRNSVDELKTPIYLLLRASLDQGRLPETLKRSNVVPIF